MKKLIVLVLALVMVVAMGFAAQSTATGNIPVKVTVLPHVVVTPSVEAINVNYDPENKTLGDTSFSLEVKANFAYKVDIDFNSDSNEKLALVDENVYANQTGNDTWDYSVTFANNGDNFWLDNAADYTGTIVYTVSQQ
ncbi:hypothetical protein OSSY52_09340 [Tepiditoga spiralis]|uniref:Uncharacterized protein n=1 Tax=Tepiditoga spiralis TaxID=2108365 RepID=A0A7G1G7E0_9BACT|nr:hypothetical protein [Tepiditoga spiralis]BBE30793.1 hypothetical protein OSSY52_09340 [Tepiditoga spiralis]